MGTLHRILMGLLAEKTFWWHSQWRWEWELLVSTHHWYNWQHQPEKCPIDALTTQRTTQKTYLIKEMLAKLPYMLPNIKNEHYLDRSGTIPPTLPASISITRGKRTCVVLILVDILQNLHFDIVWSEAARRNINGRIFQGRRQALWLEFKAMEMVRIWEAEWSSYILCVSFALASIQSKEPFQMYVTTVYVSLTLFDWPLSNVIHRSRNMVLQRRDWMATLKRF